jgi:Na+/H+-dicarboxylate symporter
MPQKLHAISSELMLACSKAVQRHAGLMMDAMVQDLERLPQLGCSRQSVGLVLPTGYAFNLDGTAIFMTMSTVFLANAYHVPLSWG